MSIFGRNRYRVEQGKTCVEITVGHGGQLFDQRDPSPFIEKDLDPDAVDFIMSAVQEFTLKTPIKLQIYVLQPGSNLGDEEIRSAIKNYFAYMADLSRKKLSRAIKSSLQGLLGGFAVLSACTGLAQFLGSDAFFKEGLTIMGWVSFWRPFDSFVFGWWELYREMKVYEKISSSPVEILHP